MAKLTLNPITSGYSSNTALNANFDLIETALENTLSRDGTTPNTMETNLDMNNQRITNLAAPINVNDAARLTDVQDAIAGGSALLISNVPAGNLSATNVQAAINELDAEKALLAGSASQTFSVARGTSSINAINLSQIPLNIKSYLTDAQLADVEAYTYTLDVTTAFQTAIAAAQATKRKLLVPYGGYKVTDSLSLATGTQIEGETDYQYVNGFGIAPKATTIKFMPTTQKSLFVPDGATSGGFRFHVSVKGLYIEGNSVRGGATTSLYAIDVTSLIYCHFENIGMTGFNTPVRCAGTVNNRFVNMYLNGTVSSVIYAGSIETTDVWEQCSFWGSPLGVSFLGSSLGIRFSKCLWEQIDTYGMDVAKECQNILVEGGYGEDVPFTATATGAMFRVGFTGTTVAGPTSLQVIGGSYAGRNAGTIGDFLTVDYAKNVMLSNVIALRYTNVIRTTANTTNYCVSCSSVEWYSVTSPFNSSTKVSGTIDTAPVQNGSGPYMIGNALIALQGTIGALNSTTASINSDIGILAGQHNTGVSTTAVAICTLAIATGNASIAYCMVHGNNNTGAGFIDQVLVADVTSTATVLHTNSTNGAPAARTYTVVSGVLKLAMGSGTYYVDVLQTCMKYPVY